MGKKGTKRKTKWRALPLGEDAGGSGNEEEVLDEDQSTISSTAGQPAYHFKRQTTYFKASEKGFRQTKRFPFDRFRTKEPLVKLESKTFDQEEYTKITTPRQDVLFKKGCFGRKRESSVEEVARQAEVLCWLLCRVKKKWNDLPCWKTSLIAAVFSLQHFGVCLRMLTCDLTKVTDLDGEEPMMDQIIITNGFVDERGHYLVNGNSYEIYDPYSNTVTVVVGPPPYANGVTQPVLAAVSCQPVPLQPVDWYPPGSDWPSQGSAWTPSFRRGLDPDPATILGEDGDQVSETGAPNPYDRSSYAVPELAYGEPQNFEGSTEETNNSRPNEEICVTEDHQWESNLRKSKDSLVKEREKETKNKEEKEMESKTIEEVKSRVLESEPEEQSKSNLSNFPVVEEKQVEKKSHSTQTISPERDEVHPEIPGKESHSTQTPPEEIFSSNNVDLDKVRDRKVINKTNNDLRGKIIEDPARKYHQNRYKEQKSPSKKPHESYPPKKIYQQRKNFAEDKMARIENDEQIEIDKEHSNSLPISYAKKALMGLDSGGQSLSKTGNTPVCPPFGSNQSNGTKPNPPFSTNGTNLEFYNKQTRYKDNVHSLDEKRNGQMRNGYVKCKVERGPAESKAVNEKNYSRDFRVKEAKFQSQPFEQDKKPEDSFSESRSPSEKSSLVSGLSSPTELSSGQNTPPEKLIIKKMEEKIACEINQGVQEKLKHNLEGEPEKEENSGENKTEDESTNRKMKSEEGKKKKNKRKSGEEKKQADTSRDGKSKKKKKKKAKEKPGSDTASSEELPFFLEENPGMRFFNAWDNHKDLISDASSFEKEDEEILKSFGIKEDRSRFSKLPLHSDLLMMLPSFGWGRPKLKIEDFFAPAHFHNDLYTKRNITNMKSTKPEEFFASVVDSTTPGEEKKKDAPKVEDKDQTKTHEGKSTKESSTKAKKNVPKTESKAGKKEQENKSAIAFPMKTKTEVKGSKLGITEAVNTWLQEQGDPEKVLSLEKLPGEASECVPTTDPLRPIPDIPPKNDEGNPIRASSGNDGRGEDAVHIRGPDGCIRVANVVNDGFRLLDKEFLWKQKKTRMYRSSSWDAKLSDPKAKSRFKFLTDSASFCQDLISDVRNGLPAKNEYATEELCDPKQSVSKYYTLAPGSLPVKSKSAQESDSDNEVFDALEYKFLTKENLEKRGSDGKSTKDSGNASITDSGVHSDVESSEDSSNDHQKEPPCKLQ